MADHTKFVKLAMKLILKNGREITLQQLGSSAADSTKPWKGAPVDNVIGSWKAMAVFVPAIGRELGTLVMDQDLLKKCDKVAIVQPVAEDLEEIVTRIQEKTGSMSRVAWCQALKPANQTVLYVIGVTR